ncbi:hypothetical protein [Serratia odorifera]|uniref:Uncharacterized protein n=2 Tax=Serratia odorifera TaxID=618 RepID=D4DVW9_SEROD|nr:hypothetical protein [Serratia odorifera]EFE98272.1 hypothetical protein HMPREF0758_0069 [Serratia odorifera DSM 4582]PNK92676.1 hypothetical protein CEQ31_025030 [Serratia odorifera]RII73855.1 hypothetical protein DX901_01495 [Serratia odorifera]VDZ51577.1 Uncharacterised protein [Serratia odorifera]
MDNKLSELSKPVAWVRYPTANAEYVVTGNVHIARIWRRYHGDAVQPVYSQEYVSALLESNSYMSGRIAELEAKLATPIKIVNYDEFFICHVSGASDDYCKGWVDGRNAAARDVGKAGFKVEGDA